MGITVAMYSHDSVGLGHARRNRAIAYALAETLPELTGEPTTGLLIAGHPGASHDSLPDGWDWLVLPGFARTTDGYTARSLGLGVGELSGMRSDVIDAALDSFSPDLFIADRHAFGVAGELKAALQRIRRSHDCATVLGLRDVLDTPAVVRREWDEIGGDTEVARHYDAVWVYGDAKVYDPVSSGEVPAEFRDRTYFTGYLSQGRPADHGRPIDPPYVLTTVGGGSDGGAIVLAAARAAVPDGYRHLIVLGPQMSEADARAVADAVDADPRRSGLPVHGGAPAPRITVVRSAPNVPQLIRHAAAVVCMGGYNSLAEVMDTTTPALVVPRSSRRAEQPLRAAALSAIGVVDTLPAPQATASVLGDWFARSVHRRVRRDFVDLTGLQTVGALAADLLTTGTCPRFSEALAVPATSRAESVDEHA